MKKKQFLIEMQNIFEVKKIEENMPLDYKNFDSLKILELISFKEKHFQQLNISPSDYIKCKKISDFVKMFKIKND